MSEYMRELRERVGSRLLEVPAVSVIVRDESGRVLLVRHADTGTWTTPGGAIEPREPPADAAVREMWEETGLHVRLTRLTGVFGGDEFVVRYANGDETSYAMVVFEAEALAGTPRPDGDETLEVRFFAPSELLEVEVPEWLPEVMRAVAQGGVGALFRRESWRPPEVV